MSIFLSAFNDLDTERNLSESQCIPHSAIRNWAIEYGLDYEMKEDLHYFIRKMDNAYIEKLLKDKE